MPRPRLISPDFWTSEGVVDCPPMARLLLLGLSNFADDFGVLPLRPRTLRLQVFPGDALDDEAVRALIETLAAHGLVRRYTVEDVAYLSIVDWEVDQRVGRRARRRYPAPPSVRDGTAADLMVSIPAPDHNKALQTPCESEADQGLTASTPEPDHNKPLHPALPSRPAVAASDAASDAARQDAVEAAVRRAWGADGPADAALHAARWRAQRRDLARDVLPAIATAAGAPAELNRPFRLALVDGAMAGRP